MSSVCLIDTSIFLNLLDVPHCNEASTAIAQEFEILVEVGCSFLLPMATILPKGDRFLGRVATPGTHPLAPP